MGPAATNEFLRLFTAAWPAGYDQGHPRVILLSDPGTPDRSAALRGGPDDPAPVLRRNLRTLSEWGADLLAMPCNTAFAFMDPIVGEIPVPVVDIVATTVRAARFTAPDGAWLLATEGTIASKLYQSRATGSPYRLNIPGDADQKQLNQIIESVKAGDSGTAASGFVAVTERLAEIADDPLVLGCTELTLAWQAAGRPPTVIDSTEALAVECVRRLRQL